MAMFWTFLAVHLVLAAAEPCQSCDVQNLLQQKAAVNKLNLDKVSRTRNDQEDPVFDDIKGDDIKTDDIKADDVTDDEGPGIGLPPGASTCSGFTEVPWPCDNEDLKFGVLQALNTKEVGCENQSSNISVLDIGAGGEYTPVCQVPGVCLNACSINPQDSFLYCRAFNSGDGTMGPSVRNNFVRVSCPGLTTFTSGVTPVTGQLCHLGRYSGTFAASFDLSGNYYWRNGRNVRKLPTAAIHSLTASDTPLNSGRDRNEIRAASTRVIDDLEQNLADFVVVRADDILGEGMHDYLVGCSSGREVVLQNLDEPNESRLVLDMQMTDGTTAPRGPSGAQWYFRDTSEAYCAFNREKGVVVVQLSTISLTANGTGVVNAGTVSRSFDTRSNDGMNCIKTVPCPFPDPSTTSSTSTTTTAPYCPYGEVEIDFSESTGGNYEVDQNITNEIFVQNFAPRNNANNQDCLQPAILTPDNADPSSSLSDCTGCNLLVFNSATANQVDACTSTGGGRRPRLTLGFHEPLDIVGVTLWDQFFGADRDRTQLVWRAGGENQVVNVNGLSLPIGDDIDDIKVDDVTVVDPKEVKLRQSGNSIPTNRLQFVDLRNTDNPPLNVSSLQIRFGQRPGVKSITVCKSMGGGDGDPHIETMDGQHYTLLRQGTFMLWGFKGLTTRILSESKVKDVHVEWTLYAHYAGHASFTKGLLLLDSSSSQPHALELMSMDCKWRSREGQGEWTPLEKPHLMMIQDGSDTVTSMDVIPNNATSKDYQRVKLSINSQHGVKSVATIHISCRPGHFINTAIIMERPGDRTYVQGQVGVTSKRRSPIAGGLSTLQTAESEDQEFMPNKEWSELGGSLMGQTYLSSVDETGTSMIQRTCTETQKVSATEICQRHLGAPSPRQMETFSDCVYDVCTGGGEVSAELMAVIVSKSK